MFPNPRHTTAAWNGNVSSLGAGPPPYLRGLVPMANQLTTQIFNTAKLHVSMQHRCTMISPFSTMRLTVGFRLLGVKRLGHASVIDSVCAPCFHPAIKGDRCPVRDRDAFLDRWGSFQDLSLRRSYPRSLCAPHKGRKKVCSFKRVLIK